MDQNSKKTKEVEGLKKEKIEYDNIFRTLKKKFFDDSIDKKTINIKSKGVIEELDNNKKSRSVKFEKLGEEKERLKSFENEDNISFKCSNSIVQEEKLGFNYKSLSYAEKFYDEFLNIKRKCENERKKEKIKPYIDRVKKMREIMLKKINSSQCTKKDKNLVLYMERWLEQRDYVPYTRLDERKNQPTYTGKNKNDKRSVSDLDSIYTPYDYWDHDINEKNIDCVMEDLKKSEPTFENEIENNKELYKQIIDNVIPQLQKFDYSNLFDSLRKNLNRDTKEYLKSVVELEKRYGGSEQLKNELTEIENEELNDENDDEFKDDGYDDRDAGNGHLTCPNGATPDKVAG